MDANVMDAVTLVMLAVGLAMDAFAVSITDGLCYENFHRKEALITSGAFGLFQGIMPLIGYFCGRMFSDAISSIDHWIALILLGVIGLNMIKEAWQESRESECENCGNKTLTLPTILMQAVATSHSCQYFYRLSVDLRHHFRTEPDRRGNGETFRFDGQRKSPGSGRCDFDSDRAADLCGTHVFLKFAEISS